MAEDKPVPEKLYVFRLFSAYLGHIQMHFLKADCAHPPLKGALLIPPFRWPRRLWLPSFPCCFVQTLLVAGMQAMDIRVGVAHGGVCGPSAQASPQGSHGLATSFFNSFPAAARESILPTHVSFHCGGITFAH